MNCFDRLAQSIGILQALKTSLPCRSGKHMWDAYEWQSVERCCNGWTALLVPYRAAEPGPWRDAWIAKGREAFPNQEICWTLTLISDEDQVTIQALRRLERDDVYLGERLPSLELKQ